MDLRTASIVASIVWFVNAAPSAASAPAGVDSVDTTRLVGTAPQASTSPVQIAGTAIVRGRVADEAGTPITGVTVHTTWRNRFAALTTQTDAQGRYELRGLPRMSLTIAAIMPGYTGMKEGFEALQIVTLSDGEVREGVDLVLVRGGVVTGRVTNRDGGPLIGATVRAVPKRRMPTMGQPPPFGMSDTSDDRGAYRLHGLPAGDYYLSVLPPQTADWGRTAEPDKARGFAQAFYPGVPDAVSAQCVAVTSGTETTADVTVPVVPLFTIAGQILDRDGQPTARAFLSLRSRQTRDLEALAVSRSVNARRDGTFRLANVAPGSYRLVAIERSEANPQPDSRMPAPWHAMREMDLDVSGDVSNLALRLSNGTTLTGRVVSATPLPKDVTSLQIYHRSTAMTSPGWMMPPVMLGLDGRFEFIGLRGVVEFAVMLAPAAGPNSPAALRQSSAAASLSTAAPQTVPDTDAPTTPTHRTVAGMRVPIGWRVRALRLAGRDVTDEGIDLGQEEGTVSGVEVEVADDVPVVTGIVRDEQGQPYPGARLVAIATDPKAARSPDGIVRPGGLSIQDGRYVVSGLAPGTWDLIALANAADPTLIGDDAANVASLRARATRVTLAESQVLELDLDVVRKP